MTGFIIKTDNRLKYFGEKMFESELKKDNETLEKLITKSLENAIKTCQTQNGHERCFLNHNSKVKCQYMGEKKSENITDSKTGRLYIGEYFTCEKY